MEKNVLIGKASGSQKLTITGIVGIKLPRQTHIKNTILSSPGGRKGSTCCAGVRSFGKPEADNHVDQGHDAHRPEVQPETEPDEAR